MKRYLAVTWHHDLHDEPTELLSEVVDGEEARKVEKYRDGRIGWAGADGCRGDTVLAEGLMPFADELEADPEFNARTIGADEFEHEWRLALERQP